MVTSLGCAAAAAAACTSAPPPRAPLSSSAPPPAAAEYVSRELQTGAVLPAHYLTTYRLQHQGARATLTVTRLVSNASGAAAAITDWRDSLGPITYTGAVVERGDTIELSLTNTNGTDQFPLHCIRVRKQVAAATAVRTRTPGAGDECVWSPRTTTAIEVLACGEPPEPGKASKLIERLVFARSPGVEWLSVNDDCSLQGGGLRGIPADGSVAPFRPPQRGP